MNTPNPMGTPNRCQMNIFKYNCLHKGQESGARCSMDGKDEHCITQVVCTGIIKDEDCEECMMMNFFKSLALQNAYRMKSRPQTKHRNNQKMTRALGRFKHTRNNGTRKVAESKRAKNRKAKTKETRFKPARQMRQIGVRYKTETGMKALETSSSAQLFTSEIDIDAGNCNEVSRLSHMLRSLTCRESDWSIASLVRTKMRRTLAGFYSTGPDIASFADMHKRPAAKASKILPNLVFDPSPSPNFRFGKFHVHILDDARSTPIEAASGPPATTSGSQPIDIPSMSPTHQNSSTDAPRE
ncbi:hypothetical protein NHQ30_004161 [Ciborinia camelliae]|nr:hypothetical protein NHQ30_004161 [Ciborinia camelliae]